MVNIAVKELQKLFETKEVNLAQVNTEDGRTFSISIHMKILENDSNEKEKNEKLRKQCNDRSNIECDTSGCMNSSPDSDRSGILNPPEFINAETCNVDDFLNNFDDPTVFPPAVNEDLVDEDELESNADSDCNSDDVQYFVVDKIVAKRFNALTNKHEFLLRVKRYLPQDEIIWNPLGNQDDFSFSLIEHSRLFIEMPAPRLKKEEKRKRSVLQDKFLSEVNIPSEKKSDYQSSAVEDHRNSNVCRKLDSLSMVMVDNSLNKFDNMNDIYLCSESNDAPIDMAMTSNLAELVPILIDPVHVSQPTDCAAFQNSLPLPVNEVKPPERSNSRRKEYFCADCDYHVSTKVNITKHVRQHLTVNKVRRNNKRKPQDSSPNAKLSRSIKLRTKESPKLETKRSNGLTSAKKERKRTKSGNYENGLVLDRIENDSVNEGEIGEKVLPSTSSATEERVQTKSGNYDNGLVLDRIENASIDEGEISKKDLSSASAEERSQEKSGNHDSRLVLNQIDNDSIDESGKNLPSGSSIRERTRSKSRTRSKFRNFGDGPVVDQTDNDSINESEKDLSSASTIRKRTRSKSRNYRDGPVVDRTDNDSIDGSKIGEKDLSSASTIRRRTRSKSRNYRDGPVVDRTDNDSINGSEISEKDLPSASARKERTRRKPGNLDSRLVLDQTDTDSINGSEISEKDLPSASTIRRRTRSKSRNYRDGPVVDRTDNDSINGSEISEKDLASASTIRRRTRSKSRTYRDVPAVDRTDNDSINGSEISEKDLPGIGAKRERKRRKSCNYGDGPALDRTENDFIDEGEKSEKDLPSTSAKKERKRRKSCNYGDGLVLDRIENESEKDLPSDHEITNSKGSEVVVPVNPVTAMSNEDTDAMTRSDYHINQSARNLRLRRTRTNESEKLKIASSASRNVSPSPETLHEDSSWVREQSIPARRKQRQKKTESILNGLCSDNLLKRSIAESEEDQNTQYGRALKKRRNSMHEVSRRGRPRRNSVHEIRFKSKTLGDALLDGHEQLDDRDKSSSSPFAEKILNDFVHETERCTSRELHLESSCTQRKSEIQSIRVPPVQEIEQFDEIESNCIPTLSEIEASSVSTFGEMESSCDSKSGGNESPFVEEFVKIDSNRATIPVKIPLTVLKSAEIKELKRKLILKKETESPDIWYEIITLGSDEVFDSSSDPTQITNLPEIETMQDESASCSSSELSTVVLPSPSFSTEASEHELSQFLENDETDKDVIEVVNKMIKFLETNEELSPGSSKDDIFTESQKSSPRSGKDSRAAESSKRKKRDERLPETSPIQNHRDDESESQVAKVATKGRPKKSDILCHFCSFTASDMKAYKDHAREEHADKFTRCSFCSKPFMNPSSRRRHEREKHAELLPYVFIERLDISRLPSAVSSVKTS